MLYDRGLVSCYDAKTGKALYDRERLPEGFGLHLVTLGGGGRIFCLNEDGVCYVLRAGDKIRAAAHEQAGRRRHVHGHARARRRPAAHPHRGASSIAFKPATGRGLEMKASLISSLCRQCGLCCDGSLFADVELADGEEASVMEAMGLEIEDADGDDGPLLLQPCAALKGKQCSIYAHRPDCCRSFECRLLQQVRRGAMSVRRARDTIAETLKGIGRTSAIPLRQQSIQKTFLGDQ